MNTIQDGSYRYDLESYAILDADADDDDDANNYAHRTYYRDGLDHDWMEY